MGYFYTQLARFWETAILAAGSHLTISVSGIFFFGFPVAFSLGAYAFTILAKEGISLGLSIVLSLVASIVLGLIFSALYRRLSNDSFAVFTLAGMLAFDALLRSWDSLTGGVLGIAGVPRPAFGNTLAELVVLQGIVVAAVFVTEYVLLRAPFGRALQAHRESKIFLDATGVSSKWVGSVAIIFTSLVSAAAGILAIWRIQFLDPSFGGIAILIQVITIAILAVRPKVSWVLGATAVIVFLPEVLRFFPFPSSVLGHLRLLVYSVFLIILVKRLSSRYTSEKRFI